ncbi:hypothetical protein [Verrucosispora sp. WMMD573]|uniref:effector-associated constant component EACC1 n=1 Tax=Verrucosispora sp. WMMD573 TaxID=3015149 RepID=UPI00248BD3E9|nr:hypothetical protein [Verrucosispora sp. WMMD573]WBB53309.1 hypothetical protein O7601_22455 [Verrucosispora sp. WMMD573]
MALINMSLLDGNPSDLYSLADWLQRTDDFRGRVRTVPRQTGPEDMGSAMEILSVALGSGGAGAVLAGALSTWLQTRRARISVEFVESDTGETVRRVEVEANNAESVKDLYALLAPGRVVP